jgi:hypothetical protein
VTYSFIDALVVQIQPYSASSNGKWWHSIGGSERTWKAHKYQESTDLIQYSWITIDKYKEISVSWLVMKVKWSGTIRLECHLALKSIYRWAKTVNKDHFECQIGNSNDVMTHTEEDEISRSVRGRETGSQFRVGERLIDLRESIETLRCVSMFRCWWVTFSQSHSVSEVILVLANH